MVTIESKGPGRPRRDNRKWGARFERMFQASGYGIDELARAVGVSRTTLYNWRAGRSRPENTRLKLIARKLKVEERELW